MNEVPSLPPLGPSVQGRFLDERRARRSASHDDPTPHGLASGLKHDLAVDPRLVFLVLATLCMLLASSGRAGTVADPTGDLLRFAVEVSSGALTGFGAGLVTAAALPGWLPRVVYAAEEDSNRDVMVSIFLRGGADGLTLCPPHGDASYYYNSSSISTWGPNPGRSNSSPLTRNPNSP